jgi:hypothetical protein
MRSEPAIRRLERRVETLEREVSLLSRSPEANLERARSLLIQHLRSHTEVDPLTFAVRNDLPSDVVETVLQEFDRKNWTVPVDD